MNLADHYSYLQAEAGEGDEADFGQSLADLKNSQTYKFLMVIVLQSLLPAIYDQLNRQYWIRCCSGSLTGTAENWYDFYETGWTDFAAQPNKMRIAYLAGNLLDRPYGNYAW